MLNAGEKRCLISRFLSGAAGKIAAGLDRLDHSLVAVCGGIWQSIVHGYAAAGAAHCCRPLEFTELADLTDHKTGLQQCAVVQQRFRLSDSVEVIVLKAPSDAGHELNIHFVEPGGIERRS